MEIVKYNKYKKGNVSSVGSSGSNSSNSSNTSTGSSTTLSRSIWGNEDTGNDISNSMLINGNIYLQGFDADSELDDDNDSKEKEESEVFPPDDANLDGSIYASGGFFGKNLEITNDAYIKNHLYVNHSHSEHKGDKVCLIEEVETNKNNIETNKTNIASNLTEINSLKTRVSANETNIANNTTNISNNATNITNLTARVSTNETNIASNTTNIANNTTEIENIKNQMADGSAIDNLLSQIQTLKYGDIYNPVILYSGVLSKLSTSDIYTNNGCIKDCLQFTITDITQGLMTIEITPRYDLGKDIYCYVRSVDAIQEMSDDTRERKYYYKERSNGAHWFESWFEIAKNKTTIYLRELHNGNDDNDTWYSSSWFENGGIRAVNLTINGYVSFL